MSITNETFGPGGYDPQAPGGNVIASEVAALPATVVNETTIRDSFTQALTRSAQIKTQMDAIQAATIGSVAAASTAIKTNSEAIEDLNTAVRRLIRLADNRLDASD